ncbi:hypothetical protein ACIRVF_17550 [Kitasatospora sp. NPDC101157]|uniref:hypothetical protein n=1 Tax=Kitasatospora sp. NPDC101157 TaxID=3364098 RepID=UPI003813B91D
MSDRYAIVPANPPSGASYQVWVVRDRTTTHLVKALPPAGEPLRFYSYAQAHAWTRANSRTSPSPYEIRLIPSNSPHFLQLDSWGLWDSANHSYLRAPGSPSRIRRFYTRAAAEDFRRTLGGQAP